MDLITLAASRRYINNAIAGLDGPIAGKNCKIQSVEDITGGHRITFSWNDDEGVARTTTVDVMDGNGIESVDIKYASSASGTTPPDNPNDWHSSVPEVPDGYFLWTRNISVYSNGDQKISYVVGRQGVDGFSPTVTVTDTPPGGHTVMITDKTGPHVFYVMDGLAIDHIDVDYAESDSGTVTPLDWQSTPPEVATGNYLWTRNTTYLKDGTYTKTYMIALQGAPGISPDVKTTQVSGGTRVTITDKDGPHYFTVLDGVDGVDGRDGADGADGFSPIITTEKVGKTTTITIVDATSTKYATILDGVDGKTITNITINSQNHVIVSYSDGTSSDAGELIVQSAVMSVNGQTGDVELELPDVVNVGANLTYDSQTNTLSADAQSIDVDSEISSTSENPVQNKVIKSALDDKVDKVSGKGLSENDYTTSEKNKLAGIESGAEVNVQSDWNQTDTTADDYIKNKPDIPAMQLQSDWNQTDTTAKDYIKNKPTIPAAQVNADWNSTSGVSEILNKPTLGTAASKNVPASGNASTTEVVMGNDTRLTDARTPVSHTHTKSEITDFPTLGTAAAKNSTNSVTENSTDLVESGAVKTAIDSAISRVYKPAGNKTCAQLTSVLLVKANLGNVYNMTNSGTTTSDFVEGAGKTIELGDNVAVVDVGTSSSPSYKFDLLSGMVDLTNYIQKSSTAGLIKNDGSVDTTAYAKQSEMSVTNGTGTDADKVTIQLKSGTSATVLKTHQDISGKVDKVSGKGLSTNDYTTTEKDKLAGIATGAEVNVQSNWTQTDTSKDDFIKNKPTLGTAAAKNIPASGNAGSTEVVMGNDTRLSDARTPTSHTHTKSEITDFPTLATVATSGSYNDLTNKPTIPAAQVNSNWNATSGVAQILNKPTLGTAAAKNVPSSGNASTTQVVMGNDTRLSDARTPTSHTHSTSDITGYADTKNTAGGDDTSSKIYPVGVTAQTSSNGSARTYTDNEFYVTSGVLTTKKVQVGGGSGTMQYNATTEAIEFVF